MRIWINAGYSQTRDAVLMIKQAAPTSLPGVDIEIYATHSRADAPALIVADHASVEPDINRSGPNGANAYVDYCLDFVREHQIDIFLVQRGRGTIAARIEEFESAGCTALVAADAATLDIIENKGKFYDACHAAGLPTPIAVPVHGIVGFDLAHARIQSLGYGVCMKPPYGVFGSGYLHFDDETPLWRQLMQVENHTMPTHVVREAIIRLDGFIPEMLVMQHLPGTEWSVDCLCDRGRIITGFVRTKGQHSQVIDDCPKLMALAARVARQFNLSNLINIQFKSATPDDTSPHILEINPRMSGGCAYGALAGINLPILQVLFAAGLLDENTIPAVIPAHATSVAQTIDLGKTTAKIAHA